MHLVSWRAYFYVPLSIFESNSRENRLKCEVLPLQAPGFMAPSSFYSGRAVNKQNFEVLTGCIGQAIIPIWEGLVLVILK